MRTVEAMEHSEGTENLYFHNQNRPIGFAGGWQAQAIGQIFGKALNNQTHLIYGAFSQIEEIVDGHAVGPGGSFERAEWRYGQGFLVAVFALAKHSRGETKGALLE